MSKTATRRPPSAAAFHRDTFVIDRTQEFFSEDELSKQIGHARPYWPAALLKEGVDNGLDAAEAADGGPPAVTVTVEPDRLSVEDNGGGIPPDVVASSLDFNTRTTDKAVYVSPTRGRQGNALKTLWAAPYVVSDDDRGEVEVEARGTLHRITVTNNPLAGKPEVAHATSRSARRAGTRLSLRWPGVAADLTPADILDAGDDSLGLDDLELTLDMRSAEALVRAYSLFNPHAAFRLCRPGDPPLVFPARDPGFRKWRTDQASPPHWYSPDQFEELLVALVRTDRAAGRPPRSVRDVLGTTFRGLTGSAKQKAVCEAAGVGPSTMLADLCPGGRPDRQLVRRLHAAAMEHAREVAPKDLGVIGEGSLAGGLRGLFGAAEAVRYKKVVGHVGRVPFVLEAAFGVNQADAAGRRAVAGVNFSPAIRLPFEGLADALQDNRVDETDPAVIAVHLAFPGATATDRGKSRYDLPAAVRTAMIDAVRHVTAEWRKVKAAWERDGRRFDKQRLERIRTGQRAAKQRIIDAAYEVMPAAYAHASGGLGIAAARQVMYSARALIIERHGLEAVWKDSKYFTQTLLPAYLAGHPDETANWDVVFDDRGHFLEPHTGHRLGIGTVSVRGYIGDWDRPDPDGRMDGFRLDHAYPTRGPRDRFRHVLFVEKQGFDHILHRARIQERFDVALMSTKGMTVVAARRLIDRLSADGVTMHVLHDFDKAGLGILHTMRTSNHRYRFGAKPRVVDLGLRLADVDRLGLMSETVHYTKTKADPRDRLARYKASRAEREFLVRRRLTERTWEGERVELNAMTSDQLVAFLEAKFAEHGVAKLVPDAETLAAAYQRAARIARVNDTIAAAVAAANREAVPVPPGLDEAVAAYLREHPESPWDEAVYRVAEGWPR